jgi:hypothetical protein
MAFKKNGEVKVYKRNGKISPKLASDDKSNRFAIDDLVKRSNEEESEIDFTTENSVIIQDNEEEKEDVSN